MTGPRLHVGIAELEVARAPAVLYAVALGSCVAVILYDAVARVGGLAHVLLPSPNIGRRRSDQPARAMPGAVGALIEAVVALGADRQRLGGRLVGGASMFVTLQPPGAMQMGERNILAAREALHYQGIPLLAEAVGGDFGRSVEFDLSHGVVRVTSYARGAIEL
jgi:chemotaxis protein CheD